VVLAVTTQHVLTLSVRRVRLVLLLVILMLLVLDEAVLFSRYFLGRGRLGGLYALFDLRLETSIGTFVHSTLLVAAAVLFWLYGRARAHVRTTAWILAGATFWVAMDEASQIHELLIVPVDRLLDTGGVFRYGWVIPGMAVAAAVAAVTLRFVRDLEPGTRRVLLVGGACYLLGAIGLEMLGGARSDVYGSDDAVYRMVWTSLEETFEGIGIVLALTAMLEAVGRDGSLTVVDVAP
jgi:hypothetical protein